MTADSQQDGGSTPGSVPALYMSPPLTFDELVARTHASLVKTKPRSGVTLEVVSRVLEDTGAARQMRTEERTPPARKLEVTRLYLRGRKTLATAADPVPFLYDRLLQPGITGWLGDNGSGKSSLLKFIIWGITGTEPPIKGDVRPWVEQAAVEFSIDGKVFTIRYFPRQDNPPVYGDIFAHTMDVVLADGENLTPLCTFSGKPDMKAAVANFFEKHIGFAPLQWVARDRIALDGDPKTVSWEVYSQAMIIGAEDYKDFLFSNSIWYKKHHQRTLATYLGLPHIGPLSTLEIALQEARSRNTLEKHRVTVNAEGAERRVAELDRDLGEIEARIEALDAGESVLVDPSHLMRLRVKISEQTSHIVELHEYEQGQLAEEQRLKDELNKQRRLRREMNETLQFRLFLNDYVVERCPHCTQAIATASVQEELQTGHCRVCHSELRPLTTMDDYQGRMEAVDTAVNELSAQAKQAGRSIKAIVAELQTAQAALDRSKAEMQDLPRQERTGFTDELRALIQRQGYLRGQLEHLRGQTKESQKEYLAELQRTVDILNMAHTHLQAAASERHSRVLSLLEQLTTSMAKGFGVPNLEGVTLSKQLDLSVTQSGQTVRFDAMEQSELLRLKIAFHLAMLSLRAEHGQGRHPGLLLVDAPGNGELDEQRLAAIMEGFTTVKDRLGDRVQILVASTQPELADVCDPQQLERRAAGEKFF
jgi:hypothetical protein